MYGLPSGYQDRQPGDSKTGATPERTNSPFPGRGYISFPDFVFFSHQKHLSAKVECAICHGGVKDRDRLWREKDVSMVACVDCHKLRQASLSCDGCHNIGH